MSMVLSDSDWDCYTGSSDDEGQDELESMYGGHAQNILSSLEESIGKIDDFLSFERGFLPGDVVCSVEDPSGQMGRVVDVDMIVDLEAVSGTVIKGVNSKKLLKFRSFASGDYVVCGQWLGKVVKVVDTVTVLFEDGAKCDITVENPEILEPHSKNSLEDAQYPYYPGQRVRVRLPSVINCGFKSNQEVGIVCHVEVGLVQVNWISCVGIDFNRTGPTPTNLQDPKDLILLSCFSHANWQVGDWCLFPFDDDGDQEFCIKKHLPKISSQVLRKMHSKPVLKRGESGSEQIFVIVKTKTKVDVIWQDGNYSISLDAQSLAPVDNIGVHEFWPEQFVLKKVPDDNSNVSDGQRVGIVKNMDSKERTVRVKWTPSSPNVAIDSNEKYDEEIVSAYELTEHPDYSYCMGDVVIRVRNSENSERIHPNHEEKHDHRCFSSQISNMGTVRGSLGKNYFGGQAGDVNGYVSCIGIVNGIKDGEVEVKWASGVVSKVGPDEIVGISKPEDIVSTPPSQDDAEVHSSQWMLENDKQSSGLKNEKAVDDSAENLKKDIWDSSAFSLPRAAIGFLTSVASSVFGLRLSSSAKSTSFEKVGKSCLDIEDLPSSANSIEIFGQTSLKHAGKEIPFASISENSGAFKRFDTVGNYLDHHFLNAISHSAVLSQVKRGWLKKVHQEWQILERDIPDTIYVRVYEERMDLMRAAIVGAPGTPYHDGLFFFDIFFPPDYPNEPPMVHYYSGGLRLNPNLYESGRVCLSLLKTWTGTGTEVWNPERSTILQVLLSLQALVLNEKPYFNEAGYDRQIGRAEGEKNSTTYNENAFLLSIKSMLYLLRNPPKHFEALVNQHFSNCSQSILLACKAYMNGAAVGRPFLPIEANGEDPSSSSTGFRIMLAKLFPILVSALGEKGIDCNKFLGQINEMPIMG
ncbi:probable ubiquitin-conjugating enzyme E2 24 isoform X2 [Aristolochia californica]|uniref:probable ubiquitin-conjugating enzyme E2 24 isoform X2 n=1 Tax=Aristolochia californica TaxID=171875 RepID=UPI0035E35018